MGRAVRGVVSIGLTLAVAGAVPDCVCHRDATIRPALTIHVVDSSGKPVAGALVMVVHQTEPYSGIADWWPMETGADGAVSVTPLAKNEAVAYFCMHGVTQHVFFACAGKAGSGVEIVWVKDNRELELRLHDDYKDDCWNRNAYSAGGDLGWTLTRSVLEAARAQVERLPPEGHWPSPSAH